MYRDQDQDTFGSNTDTKRICGSALPAGYVRDSTDCCDSDALAKPGQALYFGSANACGNFDYNCLNGPEPQPALNAVINMMCNTTAHTCSTPQGFASLPACGAVGDWFDGCGAFASPNGGSWYCIPSTTGMTKQLLCH